MFWRLRKSGQNSALANPVALEKFVFLERNVLVRRKARKRSISLSLQVDGCLRVCAPKSVSISTIQGFLLSNKKWIETHTDRYREVRALYPRKLNVQDEIFPMLGEKLALTFRRGTHAQPRFDLEGEKLIAEIPPLDWPTFNPRSPHPELTPRLKALFCEVGKRSLASRLKIYSERMGLAPTALRFRSQKTRWGSCTSQGVISLNWRLVVAPIRVVDYVVVHELAHLRHYNHSKSFWALVVTQIPDYREARAWLRDNQYDCDFLAKHSELHRD